MKKINGVQIPLKTIIQVNKEKKHLKAVGNKYIATGANKNGDVVILSYNDSQNKDLKYAHVIRKDGTESVSYYTTSDKQYRSPYVKKIETWNKVKNNLTFNNQVTIQYNGTSKIPESVSTMYIDRDGGDGVEINTRYPYREYAKHFQKPQE